MFMFNKKEVQKSTSTGLKKEAKKFQEAVAEINSKFKPTQIDIALVNGVSKKFGVDTNVVAEAFETYLRNNALRDIRRIKASNDYTVLHLEQAAGEYGYELDDLGITYFSVE